jgi:hypothetical protein
MPMKIYIVLWTLKDDTEATNDIDRIFLDKAKADEYAETENKKYFHTERWVQEYEVEE